jgi:hypothetical protein
MLRKFILSAIISGSVGTLFAQNVFKVGAGATIKTTGGVVITLQDVDLQNDGTLSQGTGEGTFRFTGTQNNTISGSNGLIIDVINIAKTGSGKLSLLRDVGINSSILFTSNLIDLNTKHIYLSPSALLMGESETSRVTGPMGGFIEMTTTLTAPTAINPGNLGAVFTTTQDMGSTTIRRGHTSQTNGQGLGNSILRYFDIIPTNNTALNATLRMKYFDAELNGLTESVLVMWKSPDNIHWLNQGFTTRSTATNYVEKTGLPDFSRWTLSSPTNPLPVEFLLFNVRCGNTKVNITWKTALEINSHHFNVERSADGIQWSPIGNVPAAGNSTSEKSYSFTDNNPLANGAMYRIAQYDIDGKVKYTSIIRSDCGNKDLWNIWPNPVQEELFVNINAGTPAPVIIRIYNVSGAMVREQHNALLAGSNQINVDMSRLASGTYHVVAEWRDSRKMMKVIKQ